VYKYGNISVTNDAVTLSCYYMPSGAPKTIRFWEITEIEEVRHTYWTTKGWGAGADCKVWWHFDWAMRGVSTKRTRGIVLHTLTGNFSAGLSPRAKDYDHVLNLLREGVKGAAVKSGHRGGSTTQSRSSAPSGLAGGSATPLSPVSEEREHVWDAVLSAATTPGRGGAETPYSKLL
jgi:hypothetical protein